MSPSEPIDPMTINLRLPGGVLPDLAGGDAGYAPASGTSPELRDDGGEMPEEVPPAYEPAEPAEPDPGAPIEPDPGPAVPDTPEPAQPSQPDHPGTPEPSASAFARGDGGEGDEPEVPNDDLPEQEPSDDEGTGGGLDTPAGTPSIDLDEIAEPGRGSDTSGSWFAPSRETADSSTTLQHDMLIRLPR